MSCYPAVIYFADCTFGRTAAQCAADCFVGCTAVVLYCCQGIKRRRGDLEFAVRGGIDDLTGTYDALKPNMALTFPFELDVFQKEAVCHLEAGHSVSVTTHDTSVMHVKV